MFGTLEHPADAAPRPADLLARVDEQRRVADAAEVEILRLAALWADAHPATTDARADRSWPVPQPVPARPVTDAERVALSEWHPDLLDADGALATSVIGDVMVATDPHKDPLGADDPSTWVGIPAVAWDAPAAFAAANRMSTTAARALMRDALVLRYRLSATWREVEAGRVTAWRARRIAQTCLSQPIDVVEAVDAAVAPVAGSIGPIALTHLLDAVMMRLHAELRELEQHAALDQRSVTLDENSIGHTGIAEMVIRHDWSDLVDLDATLTRLATALTDPALAARIDPSDADRIAAADLTVRKAVATAALADPELAVDLLRALDGAPAPARRAPARRQVDLVVHLTDLTLRGLDPVARCEALGPVLTSQVAAWCGKPDTAVRVRPVINLDDVPAECHERSGGVHDIGDLLRETVAILHPRCVHPYCERQARACDLDHVEPWPEGPTCEHNLAPLCRHHHRLKTHTGWTYEAVDPLAGIYHWTSPHGLRFLVDHRGTHALPPRSDSA